MQTGQWEQFALFVLSWRVRRGFQMTTVLGCSAGGGVLFCVRATVTVKSAIPASSINTDQHIIYCKNITQVVLVADTKLKWLGF